MRQLRHPGVQKALDEVGAKSEIVGTGGDLAAVRTTMVQYLIGHPDAKAILALGLQPLIEALPGLKEAGMNVPVAGFDVSTEVLDGIKWARSSPPLTSSPTRKATSPLPSLRSRSSMVSTRPT